MPRYNTALQTMDNIGNVHPKVVYIPLWSSSTSASTTTGTIGASMLGLGSSTASTSSNQNARLHTLDAWSPFTLFALEVSMYNSSASGTSYAVLFDFTTNAPVTGTTLAINAGTTVNAMTTARSPAVSLTPGHTYGVAIYSLNSSTAYCSKASLVAFPA